MSEANITTMPDLSQPYRLNQAQIENYQQNCYVGWLPRLKQRLTAR